MRFDADVGGVLNGRDLSRRFLDAQLRDQRRGVGDFAEGIARSQLAGIGFGPRSVETRMGAERLVQLRFELLDRQDIFETGDGMRIGILGRCALARVSFRVLIVTRQKEDLGRSSQQQRRAGLAPAGQVVEVRLLLEPEDLVIRLGLSFEQKHAVGSRFAQRLTQSRPSCAKIVERDFSLQDRCRGEAQHERAT